MRRAPSAPRAASVVGVLGELLITAGVLVLLFLGWQLWLNDIIVGNQLHRQAVRAVAQAGTRAARPRRRSIPPTSPR